MYASLLALFSDSLFEMYDVGLQAIANVLGLPTRLLVQPLCMLPDVKEGKNYLTELQTLL